LQAVSWQFTDLVSSILDTVAAN